MARRRTDAPTTPRRVITASASVASALQPSSLCRHAYYPQHPPAAAAAAAAVLLLLFLMVVRTPLASNPLLVAAR